MNSKSKLSMPNLPDIWRRISAFSLKQCGGLFQFVALTLFLAGCATQVVSPPEEMADFTNGISPDLNSFDEYLLRSGDVLEIIYQIQAKEIDAYYLNIQDRVELRFVSLSHLNQEQVIRADGLLTLPLVGDVKVLGMTPAQATNKVRGKYKGVLREPDVYLVVKEFGAATRELKKVITTNSRGQSKLLTVRPDGVVTFPIIGDLVTAGKTIPELSVSVNREYQRYYPELQTDVILFETGDQFVYVLGEVNHPGAFEIRRPMTVGQTLALAGGTNTKSRITDIIVARRDGKELMIRKLDYKAVLEGKDPTIHAVLRPDDIIYVPRRPLSSDAAISREIGELLLFGGYSATFRGN